MILIRKFYSYSIAILLIILISIIVSISIFEIYCRFNAEKFFSYGWQTDNVAADIINKCASKYKNQKVSIVLGDSFVEFYGDKEFNLVKQLEHIDNTHNYCNLGLSGTGPRTYKKRLNQVLDSNKLDLDQVIVFLYEGNDFSDYLLNKQEVTDKTDRKQNYFINIVKGSYAINFIYREIVKKYILTYELNPLVLARSVNLRDTNEAAAKVIYDNTPKELIKKFQSNLLNTSWYSIALAMPDYFERVHSPVESEFKFQKDLVLDSIFKIIKTSEARGAKAYFCIIPHDYFLFYNAKQRWSDTFQFRKNDDLIGPSNLTKYLLQRYKNFFYPSGLFNEEDFIIDDGHLTFSGNKKLAQFCMSKISKY